MHPFWVFLILLGVAQGIFLALALWFKKENRPANRLLALLLIAVSLHLTEYAIAFETGFGNKATFYRVFKKFTGSTPTEFREKI